VGISKILVFDKVKIAGTDYSPFLAQRVSMSVTPVNQVVRNEQLLASAYDVQFAIDFLETAVATLNAVWTNGSSLPVLSYIQFINSTDSSHIKKIGVTSLPFIGPGVISTIDIEATKDILLPTNTKIFIGGETFITTSDLQLNSSLQQQTIDVESKTIFSAVGGDVFAELGLLINNVILNVITNFEGERVAFTITGKKRVSNLFLTVQEAND
jgi:hypothetical protein